jgi:hypothetical protein
MATTRTSLRQYMSEAIGDWSGTFTTSGNGAGGGTTIVADTLADLPGGDEDDAFIDQYAMVTSGTAAGQIRRISDYVQSSGTITVARAFSAQIASGVTFELHRYDPSMKHASINTAGRKVFPYIYLPVYDETLVTDQLGLNMDFESTFSSDVPANWTEDDDSKQVTHGPQTTRKFHGSNAVFVRTTSGPTDLSIYQDLTVNIADVVGHSMVFGGFMWSETADSGWFRIDFGTGGTNDSAKHAGDRDWQEEWVEVSIPSDATQIRIRCMAEDTGNPTTYFDSLYCYIKRIDRYAIPATFVHGPFSVQLQLDRKIPVERHYAQLRNWWVEQDNETRYLYLGDDVPSGYRLRLTGADVLTLPSTEAGTMEVEDGRIDAVVEYAAAELFTRISNQGAELEKQMWMEMAVDHQRKALALMGQPGIKMVRRQTMTARSKRL